MQFAADCREEVLDKNWQRLVLTHLAEKQQDVYKRQGSYTVGEGNKPAAVRLLQELEIHSLIPRFGLDGVAPVSYTHLL